MGCWEGAFSLVLYNRLFINILSASGQVLQATACILACLLVLSTLRVTSVNAVVRGRDGLTSASQSHHTHPGTEAEGIRLSAGPDAETAVRVEEIKAAIAGVHTPNIEALAAALGLKRDQIGRKAFEDSETGMVPLNGFGGDAGSIVAVKWRPQREAATAQEEGAMPNLYLLSWDGNSWQVSYLTEAADTLTVQALPVAADTVPLFAVILFRGETAAPYPVIFRYQNHRASLAWDARSDASSYTGYDFGSVQFEKAKGADVPVMLVMGRADPGLLEFPTTSDQSDRGFQAATLYVWQNNAYVPLRTEYTHNADYVLYRFIASLHLHDYKTAYSLIDPARFLKTDKPTLQMFEDRIANVWPEFTDDHIFEVPAEAGQGSHMFILRLGGGKINVYTPSFSGAPDYRITGLERTEAQE